MWILKSTVNPEVVHYLLCGNPVNVARQGKEHIILPDRSISKRHASFCILHEEKYLNRPENLPEVLLSDLHSSNGTYVNNSRVNPQNPVKVKHEDLICFGQNSSWRLVNQPFVCTTSQISSREVKNKLKEQIHCLGGHLLKEWTDKCSYLIMKDLVLTAKTVCALADGAFIVTPQYLADIIEAIKGKEALPDPQNYLPPLKEPTLNPEEVSFLPDPSRKKLFFGKTFIFQGAHSHDNMKNVVTAAGASHALLSLENYHKVCWENYLLVKKPEKDRPNIEEEEGEAITKALDILNQNGLSIVPESDIGLAIVYKSIEKYCNPAFKINGILRQRTNQSNLSRDVMIYATETQQEDSVPAQSISCTTILESGQSGKSKVQPPPSPNERTRPCKSLSLSNSKKAQEQKTSLYSEPLSNTEMEDVVKEELAENKENLGKRKRSPCKEQNFTGKKYKNDRDSSESITTLCEDVTTVQDVVDEGSSFQPIHFSTQKESPKERGTRQKNDLVGSVSPIERCPKESMRRASPVLFSDMDSSLAIPGNSCVPKSIPFEPYTLSSIDIRDDHNLDQPPGLPSPDDEKETQTFLTPAEVKQEPQSQELERPADPNRSGWLGTKAATEKGAKRVEVRQPAKQEVKISSSAAATAAVRESCNEMKGEFALPFTQSRRRRARGSAEKRNELQEESPLSKRAKLVDDPKRTSSTLNNERIPSAVEAMDTKENHRVQDSNRRTIILEPNKTVKEEKVDSEILGLSDTLCKSLVVVEVVSLLKRSQAPSLTVVTTNNGLPNFKRFKKVLPKSSQGALPRIIGGQQLVCQSQVNVQRESFLDSEPDLAAEIERQEEQRRLRQQNDNFDSDFNLVAPSRSRRRDRF